MHNIVGVFKNSKILNDYESLVDETNPKIIDVTNKLPIDFTDIPTIKSDITSINTNIWDAIFNNNFDNINNDDIYRITLLAHKYDIPYIYNILLNVIINRILTFNFDTKLVSVKDIVYDIIHFDVCKINILKHLFELPHEELCIYDYIFTEKLYQKGIEIFGDQEINFDSLNKLGNQYYFEYYIKYHVGPIIFNDINISYKDIYYIYFGNCININDGSVIFFTPKDIVNCKLYAVLDIAAKKFVNINVYSFFCLVAYYAARNNDKKIIEILLNNGYKLCYLISMAAYDHIDLLDWLYEEHCPIYYNLYIKAIKNNNSKLVNWFHEKKIFFPNNS